MELMNNIPHILSLTGENIPLTVRRKKNIKRITLRYSVRDSGFVLSAPPRVKDRGVDRVFAG